MSIGSVEVSAKSSNRELFSGLLLLAPGSTLLIFLSTFDSELILVVSGLGLDGLFLLSGSLELLSGTVGSLGSLGCTLPNQKLIRLPDHCV